jgi:CO/xanthine dehydrogenase Mo-binding subunit
VIGDSVSRRDGRAKVTGATLYTADVHPPERLWGGVLRSPLAYARVVDVDARAARELPGVHAVLSGADLPGEVLAGRTFSDVPVLCRDVVRFVGDRVAAVAAESPEIVSAALAAIDVEYDELPMPVFEPDVASRADAPVLHPAFATYFGAGQRQRPHPNVSAYERLDKGDVDQGFLRSSLGSDFVTEHRYSTSMQHQGYLEPHTCLVAWGDDGVVRVWASNKAPFLLRDELARVLDVEPRMVVVEPSCVGGDFGGKGSAMEVPLAALLSRASAGRPVYIALNDVEELTAANPRHASRITVRTRLRRDGRIVARHVSAVFDGGAYAGYKPIPTGNLAGRFWSVGPYTMQHARWESSVVYTNHVPGGHMRAPGELQATFAVEADMDRLAELVGMDPLAFRLTNAVADGEAGPLGEPWRSVRLRECLARVRDLSGWERRPTEPGVGRGVAVSHCAGGLGASNARVEVDSDGGVTLLTGVNDQGSGAHTMLLQVVANELRLDSARVRLVVGGTDTAPFDSGSSASRMTFVGGLAAQQAAARVRERLTNLAAEYLGCAAEQVELAGGGPHEAGKPDGAPSSAASLGFCDRLSGQALSLRALAARAIPPDAPLVETGSFASPSLSEAPSFAALVAEVHVDRETGALRVRRLTGVFDVGTVINRQSLEGQLRGGLIQSLGAAVMEDIGLGDDGRVAATSLGDYKLPCALDIPPCEVELITDASGDGPYGAKAVGELTNPLVPPAIANAVCDAVGVRIDELPITAERIYRALHAQAAS